MLLFVFCKCKGCTWYEHNCNVFSDANIFNNFFSLSYKDHISLYLYTANDNDDMKKSCFLSVLRKEGNENSFGCGIVFLWFMVPKESLFLLNCIGMIWNVVALLLSVHIVFLVLIKNYSQKRQSKQFVLMKLNKPNNKTKPNQKQKRTRLKLMVLSLVCVWSIYSYNYFSHSTPLT